MATMKLKPGKYQHSKKGDFYEVIDVAFHSETLEELVVYRGMYNSEKFGDKPLFVRPLKMYTEEVKVDGKKVPRFKFIGSNEKNL